MTSFFCPLGENECQNVNYYQRREKNVSAKSQYTATPL